MAMLNGLNEEGKITTYGNKSDVCVYCLREKMKEEKGKMDSTQARNSLKGDLEIQKIFKTLINGNEIVICKKHIEEIYKEIK